MSANAVAASLAGPESIDLRTLRTLRYAVGATIAMALALGLDWRLSYLTPVLALSFLSSQSPRPTLKAGASFVAVVALACLCGLLLSRFVMPYPLVYIPFSGLVLFRIFYARERGTSPLIIIWLLIAILVIPLVGMQSQALASIVSRSIVIGAAATIGLVWLAHGLFPDPVDPGITPAQVAGRGAAVTVRSRAEMIREAALTTLVVFPVMVRFYVFESLDSVLILVFIALLSIQPGFAGSFKAGKALIMGNVIGGVAAVVFFEFLVMAPLFQFMLLLTLLLGLVFGVQVFSGKPAGALYGMAYSTVLLVIGSTTSMYGDAGGKVTSRVAQIIIAVLYVVLAFGFIERVRAGRKG
jgi:hypothetical protein